MDFDLEFFLVLGTLVTGLVALAARLSAGRTQDEDQAAEKPARFGWAVDGARSFFPILLIVLLLRSFVVEPFRIPSGSMLPTLEIGDFILVNKYTYGLKLPVLHDTVVPVGAPRTGDVAVFRYPRDASQDYIKRIVGVPGDHIIYRDKQLQINGEVIGQAEREDIGVFSEMLPIEMQRRSESLPGAGHDILLAPSVSQPMGQWRVPPGHYFVMGDNRDNSNDSRAWGFVPEANLVGRAFLIWMHWDYGAGRFDLSRIGTVIR